MQSERPDRLGRFYLRRRGTRAIEICWTDEAGERHVVSTGTLDLGEARQALAEHALKAVRTEPGRHDEPLAQSM